MLENLRETLNTRSAYFYNKRLPEISYNTFRNFFLGKTDLRSSTLFKMIEICNSESENKIEIKC